jgi:DNA repair/transcription protein MET18/MMS19
MTSRLLLTDIDGEDVRLQHLLMLLANKYSIEKLPKFLRLLEHQIGCLAEGRPMPLSGTPNKEIFAPGARLRLAGNAYAVVAGILRRNLGSSLAGLFDRLRASPKNLVDGHLLARKFDMLFRPHSCLEVENHSISKRLWPHSSYARLVRPMVPLAWPKGSGTEQDLVCANYSIAVLASVQHMGYDVYKEDVADITRMVLCVLRNLPTGPDVEVALGVLQTILREATDDVEPFIKSIIVACTEIIGGGAASGKEAPSWIPDGFMPVDKTGRAASGCRNLAVMLLGFLPGKFEHWHLLDSARQVQRLLHRSCGDRVRVIRKTALAARVAWDAVL